MRVLLLADCLSNGGLERQLALLATSLEAPWEPRVWAMGGGPFAKYLREKGVPVAIAERRFRTDPGPALALWHALRMWRPHVVHSWSWMSALAAAPLCRLLGIPHVDGMIQGGVAERDHALLKRLGMVLSPIVVANSYAGLRAWGVGPERGRVVWNGFDESRIAECSRPQSSDNGRFTVVMTARMTPVKDFSVVISAARRLSRSEDGWRFVLVGDGPDRVRLMGEAGDLVSGGTVVFPPAGLEVLDVVAGADVGVLMTNPALAREGVSNSILEYMALGLPVVCGDGGGNPEVVLDGVTGYVIRAGDPEALAERLAYLRAHPQEVRAMGEAGRDRVREEFSVNTMVRRVLQVYSEALGSQRPGV